MATALDTKEEALDELLTPEDVQRLLGVGRGTAYQISRRLGVKFGRRILRVRRERLGAYIRGLEAADR
jgi:hypothetical protein